MQRKVFLNRKPKSSGAHSYPKLLLWAALGLMVLVLLTPLLTRTPSHKTVSKPPPPVQKGAVFAKIPKAASQDAEKQAMQLAGIKPVPPQQKSATAQSAPASQAENSGVAPVPTPEAEPAVQPAPKPAAATPPVAADSKEPGKITAEQTKAAPAPVPAATPEAKPAASTAMAKPPAATHKPVAVAASRSTPTTPTATVAKEHPANLAKPAPAKSAVTHKGVEYIVRIGSFSNLQNAEKLQKMLEKKGYEVIVKPYQHPTLGLLHIVELRPVHKADKAIRMLIAIQKITHAKPMLVKIPDNG